MLQVPDIDKNKFDGFGDCTHMPKWDDIPDEFKEHDNEYVAAMSHWFFRGAQAVENGIRINEKVYLAKEGVDHSKAIRAIRLVLASFEPKHEHKEAACAYMFSEWYTPQS